MTKYRIVAGRTRVCYWLFVILWSLLCGALRLGFDGRIALARLAVTFVIGHSLFAAPPSSPPVHSPAEEAASFKFAEPGYRIELVASEPLVEDPVAITFDGEGRLWVVEMRGYMQNINRQGVKDPIGRVSVLEDIDNDGLMDKSTVFLDGLVLPRAVSIQPDGVLIAEDKPLWFAQDRDGDLVADRKMLVDPDYALDSIEHSANGLVRAIDNWIYNAKEGHRYRRQGNEWIRGETEKRGQWGICQDDFGRLFYNYNHSQLHADIVPPNALTRNPNHNPSTGLSVGVAPSNRVFPIRPTLATNRGYIPGVLDKRGRIKEFTSACAPLIYRGGLFQEFRGNSFVCETVGNLIKRSVLTDQGITISGSAAYPDRDFLASTDERFRPCWLTAGPDGAIYIADIYRGVVQDGPHMSPYLREHSIARRMDRPIHQGRIWRVVPTNFSQPGRPAFSRMKVDDLVQCLTHADGWWRDMAQMHLVERNLRSTISALREMALRHDRPLARLHALWTLEGLRDPDPARLLPALRDPSTRVQTAALRILPSLGLPASELANEMEFLVENEPSDQLAFQIQLTLGNLELPDDRRFKLLAKLLLPRVQMPLMRDAALSSLAGRELDFIDYLWPRLDPETKQTGMPFLLESLSRAIVKSRKTASIEQLLRRLSSEAAATDWRAAAVFSGIAIHAPALTRKPVRLAQEPPAWKTYSRLDLYFAWPGHNPASIVPVNKVRPLTVKEEELFARGRQVYLTACVACHGVNGEGMNLLAPPLAGSDWVNGSEKRLVRVLFHGLTGPITVSGKRYASPEIQPTMAPLAVLNNPDIAAVLTYIRREWNNTGAPISERAVNQHRIKAQGRTVPWTEAELKAFAKDAAK